MAEHEMITAIHVVTETEQATENIGDIEGGLFPDGWLNEHIESHGAEQLLECLARMTSAVITAKREVEREESKLRYDCNDCG